MPASILFVILRDSDRVSFVPLDRNKALIYAYTVAPVYGSPMEPSGSVDRLSDATGE